MPRSPIVSQVSSSRACSTGNSSVRIAGLPRWFSRSDPSGSSTWQCAPIQFAARQPEAKLHRPVTRYPPGTAFARCAFGGPQATTVRGSPKIAFAGSRSRNGAISAEELATNMFHATDASARPTSSTALR